MPANATESTFELTTIERPKKLGYRYQHGGEIERDLHAVVLEEPLRAQLSRRYRHLPAAAIEQAIQVISAPEGATLDRRNMGFQKLLREGTTLRYEVDSLAEDPKAWSEAGRITTKSQREAIKARFVAPDDPLQIVIVRDMWLTGFDAPCVNTL